MSKTNLPRPGRLGSLARVKDAVLTVSANNPKFADMLRKKLSFGGTGAILGAEKSKLSRLMERHPLLGVVGASLAFEAGAVGVEYLADVVDADTLGSLVADWASNPEYQDAVSNLVQKREAYLNSSGDGSADTVSGMPVSDFQKSVLLIRESNERIDRLKAFFGSVETVRQVWLDLAALEPEHFDSYALLRK